MAEPEWTYVKLRRYRAFLERSLEEEIRWAVFEPNDEPLWARVRAALSEFLLAELERGALAGTTPEDAFFVRCDRTTMTQDDIDDGYLVCVVGVALLRPAEFVIFRIGQWRVELTPPERTRFFAGQLLTAADLEREQTYARERRRLHNRLFHRPGVVGGLAVTVAEDGRAVTVGAGLALDPRGREIVVPSPTRVEVEAAPCRVALSYAERETDAATIVEAFELRAFDGEPRNDELLLALVEDCDGSLRVRPPEGDPTR